MSVCDAFCDGPVSTTPFPLLDCFRHSLATGMLREGASLDAVSAVLRHKSHQTTAIYAKVDVAMLQELAQPWIGGDDVSC